MQDLLARLSRRRRLLIALQLGFVAVVLGPFSLGFAESSGEIGGARGTSSRVFGKRRLDPLALARVEGEVDAVQRLVPAGVVTTSGAGASSDCSRFMQ